MGEVATVAIVDPSGNKLVINRSDYEAMEAKPKLWKDEEAKAAASIAAKGGKKE